MEGAYTSKGFAPIQFETDVERLLIEGDWPMDLRGTLYRIGPNPQHEPIQPYNPLLGDGMVHAFHLDGGAVSYRNRWVRTQQWQLEHEAGRALFASSGNPMHNDPAVGPMRTDGVANTNLCWHSGKLLALEEGHPPIELDPGTLETKGVWTFDGRLPNNMTAHPKVDPENGEMIFFANYPRKVFDGEIAWYVADRDGTLTGQHTLSAPFAGLVHDFAVTKEFVIFLICPATISVKRAMSGGPAVAWEPGEGTRICLVRRDDPDQVRWVSLPARFVWHVLNGWNDGGRVTIDLCEQEAPALPLVDGSMAADESVWQQRLGRWTIDWERPEEVSAQILSDVVCEYPRGDDRFAMKPTGHGFFACHGGPGTGDIFHRGIAHHDFNDKRMTTYFFRGTSAVSEPVFVPASEQTSEGHGYLLCVVYEEETDRSHLAVMDAQNIAAGPMAVAKLEHRVPMGFHGCWLDAADRAA